MNDLRAYEVSIDNITYYETVSDCGEYLGSMLEETDLWGIFYATTPSKAKHLFIKQNNDYGLEYTDPIKVRLLAKNVIQTNDEANYTEEWQADWCKADLTLRGQKLITEWLKYEAYIANAEAHP